MEFTLRTPIEIIREALKACPSKGKSGGIGYGGKGSEIIAELASYNHEALERLANTAKNLAKETRSKHEIQVRGQIEQEIAREEREEKAKAFESIRTRLKQDFFDNLSLQSLDIKRGPTRTDNSQAYRKYSAVLKSATNPNDHLYVELVINPNRETGEYTNQEINHCDIFFRFNSSKLSYLPKVFEGHNTLSSHNIEISERDFITVEQKILDAHQILIKVQKELEKEEKVKERARQETHDHKMQWWRAFGMGAA